MHKEMKHKEMKMDTKFGGKKKKSKKGTGPSESMLSNIFGKKK